MVGLSCGSWSLDDSGALEPTAGAAATSLFGGVLNEGSSRCTVEDTLLARDMAMDVSAGISPWMG